MRTCFIWFVLRFLSDTSLTMVNNWVGGFLYLSVSHFSSNLRISYFDSFAGLSSPGNEVSYVYLIPSFCCVPQNYSITVSASWRVTSNSSFIMLSSNLVSFSTSVALHPQT